MSLAGGWACGGSRRFLELGSPAIPSSTLVSTRPDSCKFLFPIQASILNRLADVGRRDLGCPGQVGYGPRDLEHPVIRPRRQAEPRHRLTEHRFDRLAAAGSAAADRGRSCGRWRRPRADLETGSAAPPAPARPGSEWWRWSRRTALRPDRRTRPPAPRGGCRSGRAAAPRSGSGSARWRAARSCTSGADRRGSRRDRDSSPRRA